VQLSQLRLENLRNIATLDLEFSPGLNLVVGPNGAGKTSILEAAFLLSHAQSFRTGLSDTLIRHGAERLFVSAMLDRRAGPIRVGLMRSQAGWEAKVNGAPVPSLGSMLRECALVCFEPGSHALISGASAERRRFLDWGVFHVEPDYLARAREYRRALRQRNAALKQLASDAELAAWETELAQAAIPLAEMRHGYFARYAAELAPLLAAFLPELGAANTSFAPGWPMETPLAAALQQVRPRDRARGHTSLGPHRADWGIRFDRAPQREHLSRGQEKLCALACALAQARVYAAMRGEWPVIALDDLASELDTAHQQAVIQMLVASSAQVLISGIDVPKSIHDIGTALRVFHMEHGRVRSLL